MSIIEARRPRVAGYAVTRSFSLTPTDVRRLDAIVERRGWSGRGLTAVLRDLVAEEVERLGVGGEIVVEA